MTKILLFSLMISMASCAGYKLNNYSNPLEKWGVHKLKIEPFYNESNLQGAGSSFMQETYRSLSEFNDLTLTRKSTGSDGVLIAIVSSPKTRKESMLSSSKVVAQSASPTNTSNRQAFNVTSSTAIRLNVNFYFIKDSDLDVFKKLRSIESLDQKLLRAKTIYHKRIAVSGSVRREIYDGEASAINQTQNNKAVMRKVQELAELAAKQLKNALLYEN